MILYYTGTGNSKYAAKRLGEALGDEVLDLFPRIREGDHRQMESGKPWVIVTPTYAWRLPRIVTAWLKAAPLNGCKEIYYVMTCGDGIGNADRYNRALSVSKGMKHMGTAQLIMPENYIAMFDAPDEETARRIVKAAEPEILRIAGVISNGERLEKRVSLMDRALSGPVNAGFYPFFVRDAKFRVLDACVGCGQCDRLCPLKNITIEGGRPVWHGNCTHCMACICHCPKNAIEYGEASVGKPRYKCSD